MTVPDANLLLYAYNSSSPFHETAKHWWESLLSGQEAVGLTRPVLFAFLRIATSSRAFSNPMHLDEAGSHLRSWLECPTTSLLEERLNQVDVVLSLLTTAGSSGGNLVTDAQIAAIALDHGAVVHTADHDFLRFDGLRCEFPLQQTG